MKEEIFDVRFLCDREFSIENKLSRMRAQKYIGKSVKLKVFSDTRSLQQNRYLWSIFKIIGDELGYNKEDVKDLILMELKFFHEIKKINGEIMLIVNSTSSLTKKDFSDLTNRIIQFAAELNIFIPSPEEYLTFSKK
jgi:hypothetical protein